MENFFFWRSFWTPETMYVVAQECLDTCAEVLQVLHLEILRRLIGLMLGVVCDGGGTVL